MAAIEQGRITDEGIAKLRERVGKGFEGRRPWRTEVTRDAIYHLALAIGDLNPLYLDEEYAKKTRWGTLLAPPIIVQTMDTLRAVGHSGLPEGLPGVHSIWTGSLYEWVRPPQLGDRIRHPARLVKVKFRRPPCLHGTKAATPGAGLAQNHDRRRPCVPALPDVGAARLLAHGVEVEVCDEPFEFKVPRIPLWRDLEPLR